MYKDLLTQANQLATRTKSPRQVDMRKSVSSTYYALFHKLCETCANCLLGPESPDRCERAWLQTYRAPSHNQSKQACERCSKSNNGYKFPSEIEDFAAYFILMYEARMRADYNPSAKFKRDDVINFIQGAKKAVKTFDKASDKHKRAFAALILFQERKIGL